MAVQEFWLDIDLKGNFIKNAKIEVVETQPTAASIKGFAIYGKDLYFSDGTNITKVADASVVSAIRTELGTKGEGITGDIYTRLKAVEDTVGNDSGGNSLATRVTNLESKVDNADTGLAKTKEIADGAATAAASAQADATKALGNAKTNADAISAQGERLTTAEGKISTLEGKVGKAAAGEEAATGLFKDIADVKATADKNKTDLAGVKATADAAATKTYVDTELGKKVTAVAGSRLMTDAEGTKLEGIATGAQVNVIEKITVDGTEASISDKTAAITLNLKDYAKKADISSAYKAKGTISMADLKLLTEKSVGDVYNLSDKFVDGETEYPVGTNVVWTGTEWDPLAGLTDLSAYAKTADVTTAITNATKDLATSATVTTELGKKVDKLTTKPTAGTYAKVKINAEGQVTEGIAKITEGDIEGSIAATKLSGTIDKARLPTDIPAANIDGELKDANIPAISLAGNKVTGVLPADKLGLAAVVLSFVAGTSQTVEHGLNGVPYYVQAIDAAGNTVDGVQITRTATAITVASGVEHPALTVYAIGLRKTA
nr:MAG TPA: hypothetical protein [Caudoviricetes sp.]